MNNNPAHQQQLQLFLVDRDSGIAASVDAQSASASLVSINTLQQFVIEHPPLQTMISHYTKNQLESIQRLNNHEYLTDLNERLPTRTLFFFHSFFFLKKNR